MDIISVKNVDKEFRLGSSAKHGVLRFLLNIFPMMTKHKKFLALEDISFCVGRGEIIGLIGRNGSGKSTLLRIIADIYRADRGLIQVSGDIISVIGIGLDFGLNFRLTMRDNIMVCCALYGLGAGAIKKEIKNIASFAELDGYLSEPLYKFSNGMIARLIFAIVISCITNSGARILLLDEVFAVGDIDFVNKSLNKIKEIFRGELTVIMASHDLEAISTECSRTIWLDKGKIVADGRTDDVVNKYKNFSNKLN